MGKRGQGDDDDEALWEKVAGTASPLKRGRDAPAPKPAKIAAPASEGEAAASSASDAARA